MILQIHSDYDSMYKTCAIQSDESQAWRRERRWAKFLPLPEEQVDGGSQGGGKGWAHVQNNFIKLSKNKLKKKLNVDLCDPGTPFSMHPKDYTSYSTPAQLCSWLLNSQ